MANVSFNVNTDAAIILTAKLERLNKSAFPSAVRSSLNDASFAMKQKEILGSAKHNMKVRNPSFFRKFTGVEKAKGFNVNSMYSQVGFINTDPNPIKGKKAIEGMESNEVGGTDKTGAMYLGKARGQNSLKRRVKMEKRYDRKKLAQGHQKSIRNPKNKGQSTVMAMMAGWQEGKPVFIRAKSGIGYVVEVKSVFNMATGKRDFKVDFLMRSRKKKEAKAKATHFNQEAAIKTSKQIEGFYLKNSEYQFNKVLKSTR